ncbi:MAG: radical SAM protein [Candidatus Bathyarchaeota archaeon]|nr:radical SAM protein [Candidatus Bathyarchaeota archaeon]
MLLSTLSLRKCIHCSSDAMPSSSIEMKREDCLRILREALAMGIEHVAFSGGEPLVWNGLENAVALASHGGLHVSLYTSGNVESAVVKLERLTKLGMERCIFSVFGATEESHELITRNKGSYQMTRTAISVALDCNLEVELHFVPLAGNFTELPEIAEAAKSWGVSRVSVLRFVPQGRGGLIPNHALNRMQNMQLKKAIEELREQGFSIRTGSPYNFLMLNEQPKCASGIDRLIVGPDLHIYPCDAFKQINAEELVGTTQFSILGNNSLSECWHNSPYLNAVRRYLSTPFAESCHPCKGLSRCLSGCLAQKVIEHGQLVKEPDPMCMMRRY